MALRVCRCVDKYPAGADVGVRWRVHVRMMGMMGYGWGSMVLIPITFLVLIALGAYYLITGSSRIDRSSRDGSAVEILRERYAKGEITREQFLKMKKELKS